MSSGAQHYMNSEKWLELAERPGVTAQEEERFLRFASVHAALAAAAAAAMNIRRNGVVEAVDEAVAWERVLG